MPLFLMHWGFRWNAQRYFKSMLCLNLLRYTPCYQPLINLTVKVGINK